MSSLRMFPLVIGAGAVVVGASLLLFRRPGKTPDQLEQERRTRIHRTGRITDGTVIDVQELEQGDTIPSQMLIYTYDVAGVQYECSQDVTYLRQFVDLHSCRVGLPASVKYDPHNPGNSIVVSEEWSGLRK